MITTREITLDPKTFFQVLLNLNFRRKTRILYAIAAILAMVWVAMYPAQKQLWLLLAAVCLFPLVIVFLTWRTAHNKMNAAFTVPRSYSITDCRIVAHLPDGQEEAFDITHIHRVNRTRRYYLLFTTPIEFLYLPYDAFLNATDREWFEQNIVRRAKTVRKH